MGMIFFLFSLGVEKLQENMGVDDDDDLNDLKREVRVECSHRRTSASHIATRTHTKERYTSRILIRIVKVRRERERSPQVKSAGY